MTAPESAGLGRQLLIKIGDGADPEVFTAVCGFKDRSFKINNNMSDTTTPDCDDPTAKLESTGIYGAQTISISGSGKATTGATYKQLKQAAFDQSSPSVQAVVPGDGTYTGKALITSWDDSGGGEGELEFSCEITLNAPTREAEA